MIFTPEELEESLQMDDQTLFKPPEKYDTIYKKDRSFSSKY
jgi:hypothetical protein